MKQFKFFAIFMLAMVLMFIVSFFTGWDTCVVYRTVGIPCPSCGMTRAWISFLHGDISSAFMYHPLFLLVIVIALLGFVFYIYPQKFVKWKNISVWVLIMVFIGTWVIRMILFFPTVPPMNVNQSSLLYWVYGIFKSGGI